jgi:hypothetical protein
MKLIKLDARMTGFGHFAYAIDHFNRRKPIEFALIRQWCTDQWGPTVEYDMWGQCGELDNTAWSWVRGMYNNSYKCRIMLATDAEATVARLKYSV